MTINYIGRVDFMQKYLVAIDGSDYSIQALESAIAMARHTGGTVTMLTVFDTDALGVRVISNKMSYNNVLEKNANKIKAYLDKLVDKYSSNEFTLEKLIRIGNVSNEIIDESQRHDVIFMGSRGLGVLQRAFLGSVSGKVVNNVDIPTMVIKNDRSFKTILVPVDGSRHSKRALIKANEIGKVFGSKLILLNVINNIHIPQMETFDLELAMNFSEEARGQSDDLLEKAASYISGYPHEVEAISIEGDAATTILNVAEEENVDLIAMGSKGLGAISRALMGSVSNEVVNKADTSVLVYR